MGIRFHCPQGHKLNVKAFLAGKKGVCPDCGTKFRIPERSEPGLDSDIDEPVSPAIPSVLTPTPGPLTTAAPIPATVSTPFPPTPVPVATVPRGMPATPVMPRAVPAGMPQAPPQMAMPVAPMPVATMPSAVIRPVAGPVVPIPPPPPPQMPPHGAGDPLSEHPLAIWFVQPPTGGQFGPARGEVMRRWITEGRVTADSLVWREGWTEWLAASEVFPALGKSASPFGGLTPPASKSTAAIPVKKKGNGGMGVAILVFLAIICVLLVGVLAVVLSGSLSST